MIRIVLIAVAAFALAGCSSLPEGKNLQSLLDASLPSEFRGNATVEHKNSYFDFTIKFYGLHKDAGGVWQWSGLEYIRNGRFSQGRVIVEPK